MEVGIFVYINPKCVKAGKIQYKYILVAKGHSKTVSDTGWCNNETGNRAVMTAIIEALKRMNKAAIITIHTDNQYVVDGHRDIPKWIQNNWKRGNGMELKNKDLWKKIWELESPHAVKCVIDNTIQNMFGEKNDKTK